MPSSLPSKATLQQAAIRFLSYRPRFRAEVENHLLKKGGESTLINQIIARLEDSKFINDEKLLEGYIRHRLQERGKGPLWIKTNLLHLGLDRTAIDRALKEHAPAELQLAIIKKIISKISQDGHPDLKTKARIYRLLASRGFSFDQIKKAFDALGQKE